MSRAILIVLFSLLSCSQAPAPEQPAASELRHEQSRREEQPPRKPLDEKGVEKRLDDAADQLDWFNKRLGPR